MVQLGRGDLHGFDAQGAQLAGAANAEGGAEEQRPAALRVRFELRVEGGFPLQGLEPLVQRDLPRGKLDDSRKGVKDLLRVHELELDAVRTGLGCLVDERPRTAEVSSMGRAQLSDDEAGLAGPEKGHS